MKTTLTLIIAVLATATLSAQQADSVKTNLSTAPIPSLEPILPDFNFIDAAETVRAIAAEAGTIDRQKFLQDLQKRSATILSELKPMIEQMKPAPINTVPRAAVNPVLAENDLVRGGEGKRRERHPISRNG